jgi:hypothetical protein
VGPLTELTELRILAQKRARGLSLRFAQCYGLPLPAANPRETPLPNLGQSALWKYKASYYQDDDRVGQWSDVVSIPVAG